MSDCVPSRPAFPTTRVIPSASVRAGSVLQQAGQRVKGHGNNEKDTASPHISSASKHASEQILPGPYAVRMTRDRGEQPAMRAEAGSYSSSPFLIIKQIPRGIWSATRRQAYFTSPAGGISRRSPFTLRSSISLSTRPQRFCGPNRKTELSPTQWSKAPFCHRGTMSAVITHNMILQTGTVPFGHSEE